LPNKDVYANSKLMNPSLSKEAEKISKNFGFKMSAEVPERVEVSEEEPPEEVVQHELYDLKDDFKFNMNEYDNHKLEVK